MSGSVFIEKAQVMLQKHGHWWQEGLLAHEKREMYKGRNYCGAFVPLQIWCFAQFVLSQYRNNSAAIKSHSKWACSQEMEVKARTRNEGMHASLTDLHTHKNSPMYWNIYTAALVFVKHFNMKFHEHALSSDGQTGKEEMGDMIAAPERYECKIATFVDLSSGYKWGSSA